MALVVEDGSIVPGANSYVSDAEFVSYAAERGIDIPVDQTEREQLLIVAADYIDANYRSSFKGEKVTRDQPMQWPRVEVYIDCFSISSSEIPTELKRAQMEAAIAANEQDIYTNSDGTSVKKEKLDVLEVEYFQGGSAGQPVLGKTKDLINPLLKTGGKGKRLLRT